MDLLGLDLPAPFSFFYFGSSRFAGMFERTHNWEALNPHCDLEDFPSFIPSESSMDLVTSGPASAGLSSFGFGGLELME